MTNPRWKDLYRIGSITNIALIILILVAIISYFIWPYTPGLATVESIFDDLQNDRFGGLVSLDLVMVVLIPIVILQFLALYVALKQVNESYALIALVLGLVGNILILTARPLAEIVYLSSQYAAATSEGARSQYLAAGEALLALFDGTAWMWWTILINISSVISCLLMLRSNVFTKTTAYIGIFISIVGTGVFVPEIGPMLSLLATVGSLIWYALLARAFYRLGWGEGE